ncbi:MAG: hypothetical protein E7185_00415 [Erysipelotrichaceae bacterium]|nr:hypothetical protein [Erysipelotrichaceae bacterium]
MTELEKKKDLHMKQAAEYIIYLEETKEKIYDKNLQEQLAVLIRQLRDLRDLQYWFDSGERELDRLYDRYMPYLNTILENYMKLETSWNNKELEKVKKQLTKILPEFTETMRVITQLLPEDEMTDARAEVKAREAKEKLDRQYRSLFIDDEI